MTHPDNNFKDQLYNYETPLGSNVSFEKVMAMRAKRPGAIWWKPSLLVVATLSAVSVTAYILGNYAGNTVPEIPAGAKNESPAINSTPQNQPEKTNIAATINPTQSANNSQTNNGNKADKNAGHAGTGYHRHIVNPGQNVNPAQNNTPNQIHEANTQQDQSFVSAEGLFGGLVRKGLSANYNSYGFGSNRNVSEYTRDFEKPTFNPLSFEVMIVNGGRNYRNFQSDKDYTIRGINRFGQYNLSALYNVGKGFTLAAGISYTENIGSGEWRKITSQTKMFTSSHVVTIVQPGLPDIHKTVYDTSYSNVKVATNGNINYHLSKFSLPIGVRYHFGEGRLLWRASGSIAPGILTANSGQMFNRENSMSLDGQTNYAFTLDARAAFGIYMPVSKKLSFVAEPTLQYQSIMGKSWSSYNKFVAGFGVGLVFKP